MERTPFNFREIGPKYTDDQLISFMKEFYEKNGRAPIQKDFDELSKTGSHPGSSIYTRRGGWNHFLAKSGISIINIKSEIVDEHTREGYFQAFVNYFKKNPNATKEDILRDSELGLCPSVGIFERLGGKKSFKEYLEGMGGKRISFNEKEVIFFESLIKGMTQAEAAKAAGYKSIPVQQLTNKCKVNSVLEALQIYKRLKSEGQPTDDK